MKDFNVNLFVWKDLDEEVRRRILSRSESDIESILPAVREILEDVRNRGDKALREFSRKFDRVSLEGIPLKVQEKEFEVAEESIDGKLKEALERAIANVKKFHSMQVPEKTGYDSKSFKESLEESLKEIEPGVYATERYTPIPSAGLYVPHGRGSFPSMMIMLGIPASLAGVKDIAAVTPPGPGGRIDAATLVAARMCGINSIFRIGGAQAVAALAYGTESVPRVRKIFGPGSRYVAAAKRLLYGTVDIGLPAGPSESAIIADGSADCRLLALDLMIEAEHGSDSSALLVTDSSEVAERVKGHLEELVTRLSEPRKTFVTDVLSNYGGIIITQSIEEAVEIVNDFAPEHLQLATKDPFETLRGIENAGEVLLGQETPFSLANYAIGPNAILPTGGNAKTFSPLSVYDFVKFSSIIYLTGEGRRNLSPFVIRLADYEGFQAHAMALRERK